MIFNPDQAPFAGELFRAAQAAAAPLGIDMIGAAVHNDRDIEDTLALVAREPNGGIVVGLDAFTNNHIGQIIAISARHRLPAIYPLRSHAMDGGMMSYGVDVNDQFRQAASYVDRILRGEKPANLPVQAPTNSGNATERHRGHVPRRHPMPFGRPLPCDLVECESASRRRFTAKHPRSPSRARSTCFKLPANAPRTKEKAVLSIVHVAAFLTVPEQAASLVSPVLGLSSVVDRP
jgi:hypothetical protein